MSRPYTRSIASAGSGSVRSVQPRSSSARGERSASNPTSFTLDANHYDTALPPINFSQTPIVHRRTGSTLKTVMRKIFNRKRQSQAGGVEENPNEAFYTSAPMRRSGPAEGKTFLAIPTPSESKRSSPLSEENLQMQFAETHLSPTAMTGGSLPSPGFARRRRRATLPSVIFSDDESRYGVASSAISDPQEDRIHTQDTYQRRHSMLQDRRRSRSTDALRELVNEQQMQQEIPQEVVPSPWPARTTSVSTPVPDSKSPILEGSSTSGQSARPSTGTTVTSVTRESAAPSITTSDGRAEQASLPPNVRNLVHTMQQDDGLTVEQRLNTLEVKMIDLEFAIARMQSSPVDNPRIERSSRQKNTPSTDSFASHTRNKPSSGYLGSPDNERDRERDESPSPLANFSASVRPPSTSTIRPDTMNSRIVRPATSTTSLSDFNGVSIEQYSTLVTLLRREQTARRNLEGQVSGLRDDLRQIQRAALQSMEMGTMYPIHSMDSQEFLRFRRALDDSDTPSPAQTAGDSRAHTGYDGDSNWAPDDPIGPHKWDNSNGQRTITTPMI
ncbi:hypothetical protein N7478_005895 [Penicillium angulare]|uniref:uncharacterized protein n=1 Tax=Penicillium angulare TaxID=116970 RepID=UPI00254200DF|nr:uncharacterized protein N7478_005895 [Penicillium angulare]KAJ5280523.1 hypothetical protein N7478_005895 [Penicillium angulare]